MKNYIKCSVCGCRATREDAYMGAPVGDGLPLLNLCTDCEVDGAKLMKIMGVDIETVSELNTMSADVNSILSGALSELVAIESEIDTINKPAF